MSLTNTQYNRLMQEYEETQTIRRRLIESRTEEIYQHIPPYRSLDESIGSISVTYGRQLLDGDTKALPSLKEKLQDISGQKASLLKQHGYPADYLNPPYHCTSCQDSGLIEGKKCHCFKQKMIQLLYEQSNISKMLETENFSFLSYDYHQGKDSEFFHSAVTASHDFINTFDSQYHNMLFYGTVGTGKSFLSGCIAKELIETGHFVIYFSAVNFFELLSQMAFDYKSKENLYSLYEDIYNCDLVIIDDLGTELTNSFVSSQLFSFLNERHLRKKSTLFSTNLSLEELRERYSERIFSRITSNFQIRKLTGSDIRMQIRMKCRK